MTKPANLWVWAAACIAVLHLNGCSEAREAPVAEQTAELADEHAELMAKIESLVELPEGAWALADYGRNYARDRQGRVIGLYNLPAEPFDPHSRCSVFKDGVSRPCTSDEIEANETRHDQEVDSQASAGESRWFENLDELPVYLDGGCSVVSVIYYPEIESAKAACNGVA